MTRIRDRGQKRGPRHGRPIMPPVMHCDHLTIKPDARGTYHVPAGTYRSSRVTFDRPSPEGRAVTGFFKNLDRGQLP
jgi:hypothetical protein